MWKDSGRWTRQSKSKHSVTELLSRAFIEYFDRIWWYYCRHPHRRCRQQFLSWTSIRYLYRVRCDGGQLWRENSPHIRVPLVGISESDTLINKHNAEIWSNWRKQNHLCLIITCYRVKNYYLQCSINCFISEYIPISPTIYFKHLITYGNGPKTNASQYNLGTTKRWTLAHFASIFVEHIMQNSSHRHFHLNSSSWWQSHRQWPSLCRCDHFTYLLLADILAKSSSSSSVPKDISND